ncbi:MAG: archaeosortase/exosortase family protein [Sphingomicrobium sp.]
MIRYTSDYGVVWAVLNLFGVNMIVWLAALAGLQLLAEEDQSGEPIRRLDRAMVAAAVLASFVPTSTASAAALTALSLYVLVSTTNGSAQRRGAAIALSITAAILWGRVILAMFSGTFLRLDSILVGMFGLKTNDNEVFFAGNGGALGPTFGVAPGCSSLHSISMALIFSTVVHGWFGIKPSRKSIAVAVLAALVVTLINVARLAAIGFFPHRFDDIHGGWIASVIAWATIAVVIAIISIGMKREITCKG